MRFFTVALSALAAFNSVVSALTDSNGNPIVFPTAGTVIVAGTKATIRWTPATPPDTISLVLRKGTDTNLATLGTIATDTPNTGSFDWTPESSLAAGDDYSIQITWGDFTNYSPKFTIESTNTATTSTSTSTSSTSTTSTTSSTSDSTNTTSTSTTSSTTETTSSSSAGITGPSNRTTTSHSTSATSPSESSSATGTDGGAQNINGASQLSSSLALVLCVLAGIIYLN